MSGDLVSIIIRTKNEQTNIGKVLSVVFSQDYSNFEVIIVDSGSSDSTLDIVQRYKVKILTIKPEDFTFGRALNIGCNEARGKYCVILSGHSIPLSTSWLSNFISHFANPRVAAVYSCRGKSPTFVDLKTYLGDPLVYAPDNGNAIFRRALWIERPFKEDMPGTEDGEWAYFFLREGHSIVFEPKSDAIHIHKEGFIKMYLRFYREAMGWKVYLPKQSVDNVLKSSLKYAFLKPSLRSILRAIADLTVFKFSNFVHRYKP